MKIPYTNIRVKASRWPWMTRGRTALLELDAKEGDKYGWLKNSTLGRFGGGHQWVFGFAIGGKTITLNLLFGIINISWHKPRDIGK